MKPIVKHYIALALLLLLQTSLLAQQYPVQANLNVITPCPNKLSSFFPLSGSRLSLSLLLTDFAQPEVQVRLHVKIEGAGLTIQSQTNLSLPVFTLQGGVPLTLGQQVEPYFRTANLLASGNGATQFMQNGVLPEGFFTITITVLEHRRNVQISNPARSFAWIIVNDPPLLVTPGNNQTIEPGGIQNIFISWIPRHVVTPTSGSQITYNLSLWEVPQGFDPQMVVNTLQPIETVSTLSSNVIWGPDKTALTPGKRYVVAVKAIDPNNEVTFKNNGVSAAHSFVYGQPCLTPINLSHSNVYFQTADVAWYPLGSAQNFRVEFKAASEPNDAWRNLDVAQTSTTITNLSPNTQYNYRVSAVCGNFVSSPTANRNFTTLTIPPLDNECTSDISVPQTDETPLLTSLPFGQLFMAAGFPVEAGQTIQVAPNTFDGSGIITLPLFNFGIRANLKGVKVNHSLQMVAGTVEAVYGDSLVLLGGTDDTPSGPGSVDFSNPNDTVFLEAPIDSVYMNDDGTWTVVDTNGDTTVISPGEGGTLVVGSDGNGVVIIDGVAYPVTVDTNGSGSGSGDGSGSGSTINPTSLCSQTVTFAPGGSMHKYGFDPYKEALPPGTYNTINAGGQTLHLPWKSVATGGSDRLLATPKTDSTLTFAYQGGMPLTGISTQDGRHVWTLNPPGGEDNLLALCQADSSGNASVAGGVRVKSYDLKRHRVAVVPVGTSQPAFTRQELQTALNAIYAQAVTEWEVTLEQPLDATGLTTTLEVNTTDYSNDMRAMMRAYVMQRNRVPGTTYLFIIPGFADNSSMVGYMPLKSGYGFLTPTATTRDAAHELGHGVFNLRHTFSSNNVITLPEGSTQNLMDYSQGTELFKYQWDFIHNPEGGWFLWEDSEEGAARMAGLHYNNELLNENQILYFFPEKAQNLELVAGKISNGVLESENVKWTHKGVTESEKSPSFTQDISIQYFADQDSVVVSGKQGYLFFLNIERTVVLKKLSTNLSQVIEDYCNSLIELRTQFNELQAQLERPDHIDPIVWNNSQLAYSRKMSVHTTPQGEVNENDTFNQLLFQMHALDLEMEAIEDFDALYQEALSRRSSDDLWDAFVQEVIGLLPYANPLNNRETLEGEMLEQLLIKTREVLLNPSGN